MPWTDTCSATERRAKVVICFDHGARTFIVHRDHDGRWCADGLCTDKDIPLSDGPVVECTIECLTHSSIFKATNGKVETPPACVNLRTYPTKVEAGRFYMDI
jgi:3-phenylpropionate/trans-cinnamate dioxygenase ferredoxin subunit